MAELIKAPWSDWETVGLIGRGSFGTVYEIQRKLLDDTETAALKVITIPQNPGDIEEMYSDGYDSESITATFNSHLKNIVAEYSLMRKMDGSANIVNCKDIRYIQHDDGIGWDIYIRMELLTPLMKAIPIDVDEETVIRIAKDICNALVLCQKHEIVHRDIKPQNIFVSPNGDYKLGDFGIAKIVEKTTGGTKIGTYKYMAPEVYNNQPYGRAADIYSLGLVLYWLLNERRMPFMPLPPEKIKAGQDEEARYRRLSGEKLPVPAHGSNELKQIVLKACEYDSKDRYATAAEMLDDLNKLSFAANGIVADGCSDDQLEEHQDDEGTVGPIFGIRTIENEINTKSDNTTDSNVADSDNLGCETTEGFDETATVGPIFAAKTVAEEVLKPEESTISSEPQAPKEDAESIPKESPSGQAENKNSKTHRRVSTGIIIGLLLVALIVMAWVYLSFNRCDVFGHKWSSATCTRPKTCIYCDKIKEAAEGHAWDAATCIAPKTCARCGETSGSVGEHKWDNETCTTPKTCMVCGDVELGHNWIEATLSSPKRCSWCGLKKQVVDVAAGEAHTLILMSDGTVEAIGDNDYGQCDVSGWSDVVDICAGYLYSLGIKSDGTVVAVGANEHGQCNVYEWTDIVYIAAGTFHTVGVKSDGTVMATGSNHNGGCDVSNWRDVVAVGVTQTGTIGLTSDGTILSTKYESLDWNDVSAISVGDSLAIGLKRDGTVVIGEPWDGYNVYVDTYYKFNNIIAVEAGYDDVFGLTADGRVITSPGGDYCGVSEWTDICMISASDNHIVGLKKDGTLVAAGSNDFGQCDVDYLNQTS